MVFVGVVVVVLVAAVVVVVVVVAVFPFSTKQVIAPFFNLYQNQQHE